MNIYGGRRINARGFHESIAVILQKCEDDLINVEDTNKALLLTCGDHFRTMADAIERYDDLRILPLSPETLAKAAAYGVADYALNKIKVIKAVRDATGWGLKESKEWSEKNVTFTKPGEHI